MPLKCNSSETLVDRFISFTDGRTAILAVNWSVFVLRLFAFFLLNLYGRVVHLLCFISGAFLPFFGAFASW